MTSSRTDKARLRRRLLIWSAPVALVLLAVLVAVTTTIVTSRWAATDFANRDSDALRRDVAILDVAGVVAPGRADVAAGSLAVLDGKLDEAERHFADAVRSGASCDADVNLVLVRETMGDRRVAASDGPGAIARYRAALDVVTDAPRECFADNADADLERRAVRADAEARLKRKLAVLEAPLPPAPPPPPAAAPPPPPPPAAAPPDRSAARPDDRPRQLNPTTGDPLERLQQLLEDGAGVRGAP